MGRYGAEKAARSAIAAAEKQRARADRLEGAIREHHQQVHAGNWGHDDELWAVVGLEADSEVIG